MLCDMYSEVHVDVSLLVFKCAWVCVDVYLYTCTACIG